MPGELEAELKSHPSPSLSSTNLQPKAVTEHEDYRAATQPPLEIPLDKIQGIQGVHFNSVSVEDFLRRSIHSYVCD
jgi:hypothetical protein